MTRSIETIDSADLQDNLPATRRLTALSAKRNDKKILFSTLTKVPQCNESRMIENILGNFEEVYRLVSSEKDYSTIIGVIPSKTSSVPLSQKKKLQRHSSGSYLNKLQNTAIRLKTENKRDCKMGPEEYELPNASPKCDIKEVLEQMIINIAPITPLPPIPPINMDKFNDIEKTFKSTKQLILKDRVRTIMKPINFVKASTPTESKPTDSKSVQKINTATPDSDIKKNSASSATTEKSADYNQNNKSNAVESDGSDCRNSSSSSDSNRCSDSESGSSSNEDSDVKNKQVIKKNEVVSPCIKVGNISVPVSSLSDSSSDDEAPSKINTKDSNKSASEKNSSSTSNKFKEDQNLNNNITNINPVCNPNFNSKSHVNSSNLFNESQIHQQIAIKQNIGQNNHCIKQVDNLQNRSSTYRTYPLTEGGKISRPLKTSIKNVPNSTSLSNLNDTKICFRSSQISETTKTSAWKPNVTNIGKSNVEKLPPTNINAGNPEETELHFKSSTLSGSSSSDSSSSSSNSSSSSDCSSSSDSSSSSSDSEGGKSPSSDSQNVENIQSKVFGEEKTILSPKEALFTKLKQYNENEIVCSSEIISQSLKSDNSNNLKCTTPITPAKETIKIQKTLVKKAVHSQKTPSNLSKHPKPTRKPKNNSIKSLETTTSKSIKSSKIKSLEFIEDSHSSSNEDDSGRLSAARIRPFTNQNKKSNKPSSFEFDSFSITSAATEVPDASSKPPSTRINQQSPQCDPNFVAETITISTIIPEKMNEQPPSSDADSESEPDDIMQKKYNKTFKVDPKKKQALPKVFGRMLLKENCSQNSRSKSSNKNELELAKPETLTSPKSVEKEQILGSSPMNTSDSMNKKPLKLKIDLKCLRCVNADNEAEDVKKESDDQQKCDRIDITRKQNKIVPDRERLPKIPIKKKHSENHRQNNHQTKSIDRYSQPKQVVKEKPTFSLINSKSQPKDTGHKNIDNSKSDNIEKKQNSESFKRKRRTLENTEKAFDTLFAPDFTKTKNNEYLPNSSVSKKLDNKLFRSPESSNVEVTQNNSFTTPKPAESTATTSLSINSKNSSTLRDIEIKHQQSMSYDRRDKNHQKSSSKNNQNHFSKSDFKADLASISSVKDCAKKHKRESVDDFRRKHQKMCSNYRKSPSNLNGADRESKHKTSDSSYQKSSSQNRKGSTCRNKREDLEERTCLKTSDHKSDKQEERMTKGFEKSVRDTTARGHKTGSDKRESGNQSSLSSKILNQADCKLINLEQTHSKKGTYENKPDRPFLAPTKVALSGNSHSKGGRSSSESSTDAEKPIKRRKSSANCCTGKRVKIGQEQRNIEPKTGDPAVSPISSDWICEDDDEANERPGELFANYATFGQKIDETEILDRKTLISRGRDLKRAADADCYHMRQVLLYLDSCLHYMRASALPVPNDRTAASRLSLETLPLISFTRKRCSIKKTNQKNKDKFRIINILCLRCEGILYNHLFKLKQPQCFEVMKEVEDFFDTGKGDLLRENTPPSSSPGREYPFLPSNRLLNTIQRQNAFLQYLTHSQILWEKADKLTASFEDFFRELNVEYGEMSVYKPMTHVYNFTRGAIAKLLKQE